MTTRNQKSENNKTFVGMNGFVWWFGIVENRADPDFLGRCQVRIYGFHDKNFNIRNLPWAHPIIPIGQNTVNSPAEGTLVFGFFADIDANGGTKGNVPIMIGTVPHIPVQVPDEGQGFSDPFTAAVKAQSVFPRKIDSASVSTNADEPEINANVPQRNPGLQGIGEPTTSKLARPNRIESPETGESIGIRSNSIEGTTIDRQRKNRVKYIKTAKEDVKFTGTGTAQTSRVQEVWNEPFPSYNAKFPFNHVQESESGHAFEMDDTKDFERVQISHRTGSTLEFLPSGSIKEKSFNHKYDVVMGNHKEYVQGDKIETVQGGMFLRINGKLVIQADGIDFESSGDINFKGKNVKISTVGDVDVSAIGGIKMYGALPVQIRSTSEVTTYGGKGAYHGSGGVTTVSGTSNPISESVINALRPFLSKSQLERISSTPSGPKGVSLLGENVWVSGAIGYFNTGMTQIAPPLVPEAVSVAPPEAAKRNKAPFPVMRPTQSTNKKEKTDGMGALERQFVGTPDTPEALLRSRDAIKVTEDFDAKLQNAADNADLTVLTSDIPQLNSSTEGTP